MKLRTLIFLFVLVSTLFPGTETRKIKKSGTGSNNEPVKEAHSHVKPMKQGVEPKQEEKESHPISKVMNKQSIFAAKNVPNLKLKDNDDNKQEQTYTMTDDKIFITETNIKMLEKIGGGNFSSVWKAEDRENKKIAVKKVELNKENVAEHEKKILEKVAGIKNITQMREFWSFGNTEYYVFDLYEGSLDSYPHFKNKEGKFLKWKKTLKQILEGLAEIHKKGIMHLDIKPHNIMVKGQDVFIGDFGIAQEINENNESDQGTVLYKAPEQNSGNPETKSDIWAVGNLLLWLCTGKTLNSKLSKEETSVGIIFALTNAKKNPAGAESILKEMLDSIEKQLKELNIEENDFPLLSKLLWQMMTVDPKQRPSAEDLLKQL